MEPQITRQLFVGSDAELIQLIVDTYHGRTQEDIRRSELIIIGNLYAPGFMERLSHLLMAPSPTEGFIGLNPQNFRRAIANLIKKFSYDWAQKKGEKQMLVRSLFELIMNQSLSMKVKQLLGIALEHQLNADESGSVKQPIQNRVIELMSGQQALNLFGSLLVVETAYLNSLVEIEDQILALERILPALGEAGLLLHRFIVSMPMEEWLVKDKLIMPQITKLFELLETEVERIMDERQYFQQEIGRIRQSPYIQGLFEQYLLLFHCNHSVVSQSYPHINSLKNIMLSTISLLFEQHICSQRIFHIIYLTFLAEAKTVINDIQVQHILVNCLTIMTGHMHKKFYLNIFTEHTMETIFALFMYSATNQEEYDAMIDEPQKFMQIAEQYTEADSRCQYLKVKAASFLQVFAATIDEAPRRILEMLMVILNGSLQVGENESALLAQIKNQFARFNFFGLDPVQKIETSLMVLATLSNIYTKRPDMNKVIIAFFLTQFEQMGEIQNQIVALRIMRVISYFPCALYFLYIEKQISRGRPVFVLQGIKSLERILRTNRFNELFQFIGNIIGKLMNFLKITDPIMELIIINNFDKMLISSNYLNRLVRNKLKQEFFVNYQINQHACIVCFNLLYVLIKKEQRYEMLVELENQFEQISIFLQLPNHLQYYNRYEDKLLEIYMIMLNKHAAVPKSVQFFAERSLMYLARQEKGTLFFKFYNCLIVKLDNAVFKLDDYFRAFFEELCRRFNLFIQSKNTEILDTLPYYCFIMSQIMANHGHIQLNDKSLRDLLGMANSVSAEIKQYPLAIFLTYVYLQPYPAATFLRNNNMYEGFLTQIVNVRFQGKIMTKILTISLIKLLQIQENPNYFRIVLNLCIHNLTVLHRRSIQPISQMNNEPRVRRHDENKSQQRIQAEDDNELINLFVNFKHPFQPLSQFDLFKVIYWQNDHVTNQLTEQQKNALRYIMETQWVQNKARTIKRVKKPQ